MTKYFSKTLKIFEKFSSFLLKEQKKILAKFLSSKNNFYSLLKVHKSKTIHIAIQVQNKYMIYIDKNRYMNSHN